MDWGIVTLHRYHFVFSKIDYISRLISWPANRRAYIRNVREILTQFFDFHDRRYRICIRMWRLEPQLFKGQAYDLYHLMMCEIHDIFDSFVKRLPLRQIVEIITLLEQVYLSCRFLSKRIVLSEILNSYVFQCIFNNDFSMILMFSEPDRLN